MANCGLEFKVITAVHTTMDFLGTISVETFLDLWRAAGSGHSRDHDQRIADSLGAAASIHKVEVGWEDVKRFRAALARRYPEQCVGLMAFRKGVRKFTAREEKAAAVVAGNPGNAAACAALGDAPGGRTCSGEVTGKMPVPLSGAVAAGQADLFGPASLEGFAVASRESAALIERGVVALERIEKHHERMEKHLGSIAGALWAAVKGAGAAAAAGKNGGNGNPGKSGIDGNDGRAAGTRPRTVEAARADAAMEERHGL